MKTKTKTKTRRKHRAKGGAAGCLRPYSPFGDDRVRLILRAIAQTGSMAEAFQAVTTKHGISISERTMWAMKRDHREMYERMRDEYVRDFMDVPLAYAKFRLLEAVRVLREARKDSDRDGQMAALRLIQQIAEPLGLEARFSGQQAEVEEFLASFGFGQGDPNRVPADT